MNKIKRKQLNLLILISCIAILFVLYKYRLLTTNDNPHCISEYQESKTGHHKEEKCSKRRAEIENENQIALNIGGESLKEHAVNVNCNNTELDLSLNLSEQKQEKEIKSIRTANREYLIPIEHEDSLDIIAEQILTHHTVPSYNLEEVDSVQSDIIYKNQKTASNALLSNDSMIDSNAIALVRTTKETPTFINLPKGNVRKQKVKNLRRLKKESVLVMFLKVN